MREREGEAETDKEKLLKKEKKLEIKKWREAVQGYGGGSSSSSSAHL